MGTRARGWQEETKTVYKEPECKGMHISTNFVDFQSLNTTVVLNSEMSNDWQNFIGIPHTSPFLVLSKMRSLHNVGWMTLRNIQLNLTFEHARQIRRAIVKAVRSWKKTKLETKWRCLALEISMFSICNVFHWIQMWSVTIFGSHKHFLWSYCTHPMSMCIETLTQAFI